MNKVTQRGIDIMKFQLKDGSPEAVAHAERYAAVLLSGASDRLAKELRVIFAELGVVPRR